MSLDEILLCDHLNKSYCAVLCCGTLYYALQGGSIFSVLSSQSVVEMKSYGVTFQLRATEHIFVQYLLLWFT